MISHFCPSNDNSRLVNSNRLWRWDVWQGLKLGNPMQCSVLFLCACDYSVGFTNGLLYFVSMVYFCGGFETLLLTWGRLLCLLKQKRIKVSRKIFFPSLMVLIGYSGGTSMMVSVKSFHLSSNLTIKGSLLCTKWIIQLTKSSFFRCSCGLLHKITQHVTTLSSSFNKKKFQANNYHEKQDFLRRSYLNTHKLKRCKYF